MSDSITLNFLAWRPYMGGFLGLHEYDGKVTDYSKISIDRELARLKQDDNRLSGLDRASLSDEEFYDLRILQHSIQTEIFNIEDLNAYATNPINYAFVIDANAYVKRDYAPIEERVKSIIAMEKRAPEVFKNAKLNLLDSLAKPYVETAILIARGSAAFLEGDLLTALKEVKNDSLMAKAD